MNTRIRKINENIKAVKRDTETEIRKLVAREDRVIGGNRNKKIRLFRVEARSETYKKQIKQCIVKIDNLTKKYVESDPKTQSDENFLNKTKISNMSQK